MYMKKLKVEMKKLKRVHMEKKRLRMKQILMEGEIEDTVET